MSSINFVGDHLATIAAPDVSIGLTGEQIVGVLDVLNRLMSDAHVLYIRTRNYHWNVVGLHFQELHKLFETQYIQIEAEIDTIAERIRSLGGKAPGTMTEFLGQASLKEEPGRHPDAQGMLRQLLVDHESVIRLLRESVDKCDQRYHDLGTADFLTGLMEDHEKTAWMVRAHLTA
jgi:starvation-inducible DNA-binding protein